MQLNFLRLFFCLLLMYMYSYSQTGDLTGIVLDENATAIASANVKLLIHGGATTTDPTGAFKISGLLPIKSKHLFNSKLSVWTDGASLIVQTEASTLTKASLQTIDGKVLWSLPPTSLFAGIHTFALNTKLVSNHTPTFAILSFTSNGKSFAQKIVLGNHTSFKTDLYSTPSNSLSKQTAEGVVDTLQITKVGMDTVKICLAKYVDHHPSIYMNTSGGYPRITIGNASMVVSVYRPDIKNGYYHGSRFDWSGIIGKVKHKGHTWYSDYVSGTHDPLVDGTGTAGEFGIDNPLGYIGGGVFLKIGVGKVQATTGTYNFRNNYTILDPGLWQITRGKNWLEFSHLITEHNGFNYTYTKRITISDSTPTYTLDYYLKNTGTKNIATNHYTHNFTLMDEKPVVSGNYRVTLGFPPKLQTGSSFQTASPATWATMGTIEQNTITVNAALSGTDFLWANFTGFPSSATSNSALVEETTSNTALKIEGDWIPAKYNFWASPRSICPEPYLNISLIPSAEIRWKDTYTLYPDSKK